MQHCRSIAYVLGFVLTAAAAGTAADSPPLTFKFTSVSVPGAIQTFPGGVNNSGVIVGQYEDKGKVLHGYILNGKKLTKLDDPYGTSTNPYGVNLNGAIAVVGCYTNSLGKLAGFLYKNGKFTNVPGPAGATDSCASGINDAGEIVGSYSDSMSGHGFLLKGGKYTILDVPGATFTVASGINNKGNIVLYWGDSKSAIESSLYNGKTYKTIDVPGAVSSIAFSLNTAGDVTYQWLDSKGLGHGALFHAGKYYKFDHPKSVQTYAEGINDRHVIVGGYQTKSKGPDQGFKVTY